MEKTNETQNIRELTKALADTLLLDLPPTPAMVTDFGIASDQHYYAIKEALYYPDADYKGDVSTPDEEACKADFNQRLMELDAAICNGPKLNAFVKKHATLYSDKVVFETSWDELRKYDKRIL